MSIQVTVTDTESGETSTGTIDNDYIIVVAGTCYLEHVQEYPTTGTVVLTVKGRRPGVTP